MVIVVMGVSASGKSTVVHALSQRLGWREIEADDFHSAANVDKMARAIPLTDVDRWPWLDAVAAEIARLTAQGGSVVVACSALKRVYRDRLRAAAPRCLFVYLQADLELVLDRLKRRSRHFMPPALARSQFATLEPPQPDERALVVSAAEPVGECVERIVAALER
jgi:gluconokinase